MKHLSLLLVFAMLLTLAACGNGNATPSGDTSAPNGNTSAPSGDNASIPAIDDGTYEGELDADGLFTGYGVWIYHNFRYEGYFVDGVPNGEGTLYQSQEADEGGQGEAATPPEISIYGQWVNAKGNGTMTLTDIFEDYTNVWEIEVKDGLVAESGRIEGICSGPGVDTQSVWLPAGEGSPIAFVPPWESKGAANPNLPAPKGSGTNTPPMQGQSESADDTSTSAASNAADISELVFNAQTISISAQLNGDGTITYIYKDTSIKPIYVSDTRIRYQVVISGTTADSLAVTTSTFSIVSEEQSDGTHALDLTSLSQSNSLTDDPFSVTVDNGGLSITCTTRALGDGAIDNIGAFLIQPTLSVGGDIVFREQTTLQIDGLQ